MFALTAKVPYSAALFWTVLKRINNNLDGECSACIYENVTISHGHNRCTAWRLNPGWFLLQRNSEPPVGIIGNIEFQMQWSTLEHTAAVQD